MLDDGTLGTWIRNHTIVLVLGVAAAASLGRELYEEGPINWKRFFAELIFGWLAGLAMIAFGFIDGRPPEQILFLAAVAGLGVVRSTEWLVKIVRRIITLVVSG